MINDLLIVLWAPIDDSVTNEVTFQYHLPALMAADADVHAKVSLDQLNYIYHFEHQSITLDQK